jgi:hypothetical protein
MSLDRDCHCSRWCTHGWSLRLRLPPEAVAAEPRHPSRHRLPAPKPQGGGHPGLPLPAKPRGGHPQHVLHPFLHHDEWCGDLAGGTRASPGGGGSSTRSAGICAAESVGIRMAGEWGLRSQVAGAWVRGVLLSWLLMFSPGMRGPEEPRREVTTK